MAHIDIEVLLKRYSQGKRLQLLTLANAALFVGAIVVYTASSKYLELAKAQYLAHVATRNTIVKLPTQPPATVNQKLSDAELLSMLNKTAAEVNITLNRISTKDDSVDVAIDNQQWDAILLWLEKLDGTHRGLSLVKLSSHANSTKQDGQTNTILSFTKP